MRNQRVLLKKLATEMLVYKDMIHGTCECGESYLKLIEIVIYIRVREVNFPARQLISATMAQPSG
jgi:hypothetical protein